MTPLLRAFWGAAIGAIATLALHPVSRPYLTQLFVGAHEGLFAEPGSSQSGSLPPPTDLVGASVWAQMASSRMLSKEPLTPKEQSSVLKILDAAARKDSDNAYWKQMEAVVLSDQGNMNLALQAWKRAARCQSWNDYQSERLLKERERIATATSGRQSWVLSYVYFCRSTASSVLIERFGRSTLSLAGLESVRGLDLRYQTLLNGYLLRQGSRSMPVGLHGANLVDLASYPGSLLAIQSPKKLLLAQLAYYNSLMALDTDEAHSKARRATELFRDNDGWRYLTQRQPFEENATWMTLVSLFSASLPGAFVVCSAFGIIIWVCGSAFGQGRAKVLPIWGVVLTALATGFVTAIVSKVDIAGVAVGLAVAFLSFGPDRGRSSSSPDPGPLFGLVMWVMAITFGAVTSAVLLGASLPARQLATKVEIPGDFVANQPMYFGLSALVFALFLMVAPLWGLVQRHSTATMLGLSLRRFGGILALGAITLTIIATPLAVFVDRGIERTLEQLVANEPLYYLLQ